MLHCAPSPTPPYVALSPTLPGPVFTRVQVAAQSSERQISSFSPPVPSHTVRASNGSTMTAAPTVPFTAGFDDVPGGVTFSHVPGAGRLSQVPTLWDDLPPEQPASRELPRRTRVGGSGWRITTLHRDRDERASAR